MLIGSAPTADLPIAGEPATSAPAGPLSVFPDTVNRLRYYTRTETSFVALITRSEQPWISYPDKIDHRGFVDSIVTETILPPAPAPPKPPAPAPSPPSPSSGGGGIPFIYCPPKEDPWCPPVREREEICPAVDDDDDLAEVPQEAEYAVLPVGDDAVVRALRSGMVSFSVGEDGRKSVTIECDDGTRLVYANIKEFVGKNDRHVSQGEIVGVAGDVAQSSRSGTQDAAAIDASRFARELPVHASASASSVPYAEATSDVAFVCYDEDDDDEVHRDSVAPAPEGPPPWMDPVIDNLTTIVAVAITYQLSKSAAARTGGEKKKKKKKRKTDR